MSKDDPVRMASLLVHTVRISRHVGEPIAHTRVVAEYAGQARDAAEAIVLDPYKQLVTWRGLTTMRSQKSENTRLRE